MADVTVDTSKVENGAQDTDLIQPGTTENTAPAVQNRKDEAMIVDDVVASEGENKGGQIDHPHTTSMGEDSDVEIIENNTDLVKKEQLESEKKKEVESEKKTEVESEKKIEAESEKKIEAESEKKTEAEFEKELEVKEVGQEEEEFGVRLSKEEKRKRELEMNEIRAQREPLAQITINIGPVMLDDLNTPSLKEVLKSSSKYTVTFEMDTKKKNKERKTFELIGQIKIPYAFRSQRYLVKMYELLSKLRIGDRDLSVSFPPEFVAVVENVRTQAFETLLL